MAFDFLGVLPIVVPIVLSTAAIVLSLVTFLVRHRRLNKSDQVLICREIWSGIGIQSRSIHDWPLVEAEDRKPLKKYMEFLKNDLGYFVFFVEKGVIEAHDILEYYHTRVSGVQREIERITKMGRAYADIKDYEETKEIQKLIKKYYELTMKSMQIENPAD